MPGIRIYHPEERTCVFTLASNIPYPKPFDCGQCHKVHVQKTYHINIDGQGFAIVSQEIWQKLQSIQGNPFVFANSVEKPPPQFVAVGGQSLIIAGQTGKEIRSG